jgi:uncharacterized protein (DUF2164 family)
MIELKSEMRERLQNTLKQYALEELETDIGDLKASLMLDYILEQLGPAIYNQALADMQYQLSLKITDAIDVLVKEEPVDTRKRDER